MRKKWWMMAAFMLTISLTLTFSACKTAKIDPHASGGDRTATQDSVYTTPKTGADDSQTRTGKDALTEEEQRQREIDAQIQREQRQIDLETSAFVNQDVYFEYDSFSLSPVAIASLNEKVEYLRKYPNTRIQIEGHCDERGTAEYNIALGERRAESAKAYLIRNGIKANRIDTISYGEEKPVALGSNEEAWRQNRRAHFVIK